MKEARIPLSIENRILVGKAKEKLQNRLEDAEGVLVTMPYQNNVVREHLSGVRENLLFGARNQGMRFEGGKGYAWVSADRIPDGSDLAQAAAMHGLDDEVEVPFWLAKYIDFGYRLRTSENVTDNIDAARYKLQSEYSGTELASRDRPYFRRLYANLHAKLLNRSNCHKTMLKVLGLPLSYLRTVESGSGAVSYAFVEDREKVAATDVDALQTKLAALADADFPVVVNEFAIYRSKPSRFLKRVSLEKVEAMHSFIVVGRNKKGNYICFHKMGSSAGNRIGLDFLSSAVDMSDHNDGYTVHTLQEADALLEMRLGKSVKREGSHER